ncbi:MAG: ATP-dependent Clp protease ATP-binding subunit [Alloprevotella sp.]
MNSKLSAEINRILLFSKDEAYKLHATEVKPGHILLGILRDKDCVAMKALGSIGVPTERLRNRLTNKLAELPNDKEVDIDDLSLGMEASKVLRLSELEARQCHADSVGSEHLLMAMLREFSPADVRSALAEEGVRYNDVRVALNLRPNVRDGYGFAENEEEMPEEEMPGSNAGGSKGNSAAAPGVRKKTGSDTPVIDKFGIDLTKAANEGKLDPIVGRHTEIQRIAQILSRRKKNNPILIGEPGVGKSAIVEGLSQLIAKKKVPRTLFGKRIVALDMASIVAGTQYRGQFEERLRRLTEELREHPEIILFIDEIHTIVGAGSAAGSLDAANILKPALARGEIRCIGATTTGEYKKSIEKDGALERRFQKIMLEPTSVDETLQILRNIKDKYEEHHNVSYTDDAIEACVTLTNRYLSGRALPDKAIDALDEAGSRVHLTGLEVPKEIETLDKAIETLKEEKQTAAQNQNYELAAQLRDQVVELESRLAKMEADWRSSLSENRQTIGREEVANVVSMMSGVPVSRMQKDETVRLRGMKQELSSKVIAQDRAIERIVRSITRSRLGLKSPDRPIGTFMFVGPTGVGKTHLVKTLAEFMFGKKDALIRVDMSEFGEKFSTSRLVGAPPGYVGFEEGGQLTEKVRRHPYSIILLDEIEKAHTDVYNLLLQVMDEGRMTDGNGTTVDFRNTIIVMTSNTGSRQIKDFGGGVGFGASVQATAEQAEAIVRKALQKQFAPEFLNRLDDIIMFDPLTKESIHEIAALEFQSLTERLATMGYTLELTDDVRRLVADKGFEPQYGARSLKRTVQTYLEDPLCDLLMNEGDTLVEKGIRATRDGKTLRVDVAPSSE